MGREACKSSTHGESRGLQDVQSVNLPLRRGPDTDACGPFDDDMVHPFSFGFGEKFGIVASDNTAAGREDNGRGNNGTCQGTPASFIEPGDPAIAASPGFQLKCVSGFHEATYGYARPHADPRG